MSRSAVSLKTFKNLETRGEFLNAINIPITERPVLYRKDESPFTMASRMDNRKVLLNANTGAPIEVVGKHFQYVQPAEHIEATLESLHQYDVEYKPRQVHVKGNGAEILVILDLPQFKMFDGTSEEQQMQFLYKFFYNAKGSDTGMLGLLRYICTNGQISFDKEMSYRLQHRGDMTSKAQDAINLYKDFEGTWRYNKKIIEQLGDTQSNRKNISMYLYDKFSETSRQKVFTGERWPKKLHNKWEELGAPTNLWDLYNMFTHTISHEYGSNYSSKLVMMNKLNEEVKDWNRTLQPNRLIDFAKEAA